MSDWTFVLAAYSLTWAVLAAYAVYAVRRARRAERNFNRTDPIGGSL
jgi:hypothetical protein